MQEDKVYIGKTIKFFREKNKLTQQELAEKIGISDKHLSKIERGIYAPTLINFIKIVTILNINISEFGFRVENNTKSSRRELLDLIQNAKDNEIEYYLTMVNATKSLLKE